MYASLVLLAATASAGSVSLNIKKSLSKTAYSDSDKNLTAEFETSNLHKRDNGVIPEVLINGFYSYGAELNVGSDEQYVHPSIDTGSSDLWLVGSSNPYCATSKHGCDDSYDPSTSTSYHNLSKPWHIEYIDTTGAFGWLSEENFYFGSDAVVENATFAYADVANSSHPIFGIGFDAREAGTHFRDGEAYNDYPNLPVQMKTQGLIDRVAYSLFLNDPDATDGQIIFGGVDHNQYEGSLSTVPLVNIHHESDKPIDMRILLNGVNIRSNGTSCPYANFAVPVLLDSGTSYGHLPQAVVDSLASAMNYNYRSETHHWYEGACDEQFSFDTFELDFSGAKLQVPPNALTNNLYDSSGDYFYRDGVRQCFLVITDRHNDYILGDVFLRNFYIVYDLESAEVSLAQSHPNATTPDIEEITTAVPSATQAPYYSSTSINYDVSTVDYTSCLSSA